MLMDFAARFLAHDIRQVTPTILDLPAPIQAVGLEVRTSIREVYRDVPVLGKAFARARSESPVPHRRDPWAVVAASKGHSAESGIFTYFLGVVVTEIGVLPEGWLSLVIPVGKYAVFPIRPRYKAGWPVAIAAAKRHVYLHWLPASGFLPAGGIDDFEYHDERSLRRRGPEIDLYVAIRPRPEGSQPASPHTGHAWQA
jgi:predicted transcriptional regulator YdeE